MDIVYFSTGVSIFLTLLAASMWGSWMQIVKLKKNYPITGIVFLLYTFSFIGVWIFALLVSDSMIPDGIITTISGNTQVMITMIIGGAMMSIGMFLTLTVMSKVGMLLSTAFSGSITAILGVLTSIYQEGLPDKDGALLLIIVSSAVLVGASIVCNYAAGLRDKDRAKSDTKIKDKAGKVTVVVLLQMLGSAILINGWSISTAAGTANSIAPVLTCAMIATGCFLSIIIWCGYMFTKNKEWKTILCIGKGVSKRPLLLGVIAACCHFGGNVMSILAMPAISATLSFIFGRSAAVWTYFWGILYGEFSGSRKKTYIVLASGIGLFFVGIALVGVLTLS